MFNRKKIIIRLKIYGGKANSQKNCVCRFQPLRHIFQFHWKWSRQYYFFKIFCIYWYFWIVFHSLFSNIPYKLPFKWHLTLKSMQINNQHFHMTFFKMSKVVYRVFKKFCSLLYFKHDMYYFTFKFYMKFYVKYPVFHLFWAVDNSQLLFFYIFIKLGSKRVVDRAKQFPQFLSCPYNNFDHFSELNLKYQNKKMQTVLHYLQLF